MTDNLENTSVLVPFFLLIILVLVLSHWLKQCRWLSWFLPEAGMILLTGTCMGFLFTLSFSPSAFFLIILPPIMFHSGYSHGISIFHHSNIIPIFCLATVGTLTSCILIGFLLKVVTSYTWMEAFTFGALLSATDPVSTLSVFTRKRVDPHIFALVFGESVLNDAVGLVLFRSFGKFVSSSDEENVEKMLWSFWTFGSYFIFDFVGSTLLGILSSVIAAFLLKCLKLGISKTETKRQEIPSSIIPRNSSENLQDHDDISHTDTRNFVEKDTNENTTLELSLYIVLMYIPYILAESISISGIVTILVAGMAARRYCALSASVAYSARTFWETMAYLSETAIFCELGLSVSPSLSFMDWSLVGWTFVAIIISRVFMVYSITIMLWNQILLPKQRRGRPISLSTAHVLCWLAGLRGAIAYACARRYPGPHRDTFSAATIAIVVLTVWVMGGITETMLYVWKIPTNVPEEQEDTVSFWGPWEERLHGYLRPLPSSPSSSSLMDYSVMNEEETETRANEEEEEENYVTVTTESMQLADCSK